ncbi:tetratricopeptide repeat protein, partial [Streptomyces sp. NPDC001177]
RRQRHSPGRADRRGGLRSPRRTPHRDRPQPDDTALAQALRANTTALTTCAEDALYRPDAHPLLYRAGSSLGEAGQVTAATIYFHQLTTTADRRLGPDHPDTLTTRHDLAHWQGRAGDAAGAMAAFAELLPDQQRVLGDDHLHTLTTRHNLAHWRGQARNDTAAHQSTDR